MNYELVSPDNVQPAISLKDLRVGELACITCGSYVGHWVIKIYMNDLVISLNDPSITFFAEYRSEIQVRKLEPHQTLEIRGKVYKN
jgi:hypothetical protein